MQQSKIDAATADTVFGLAYQNGTTVEVAAERWVSESARSGNYPEVCARISADELGRYSVDPLDVKVLAMAKKLLDAATSQEVR